MQRMEQSQQERFSCNKYEPTHMAGFFTHYMIRLSNYSATQELMESAAYNVTHVVNNVAHVKVNMSMALHGSPQIISYCVKTGWKALLCRHFFTQQLAFYTYQH